MRATPIAVLDSNEYITGLSTPDSDSDALLETLTRAGHRCPYLIATPILVQFEVVSNLEPIGQAYPRLFFGLLSRASWLGIDPTEPPDELTLRYLELGLSEEDAAIAAYTGSVGARYLISENRHFLEGLESDAVEVLDAGAFLRILGQSEAGPADEIESGKGA